MTQLHPHENYEWESESMVVLSLKLSQNLVCYDVKLQVQSKVNNKKYSGFTLYFKVDLFLHRLDFNLSFEMLKENTIVVSIDRVNNSVNNDSE